MSNRTAQFLSYLFHPLFMPVLGMVLMFSVFPYQFGEDLTAITFKLVFVTTIIFPGLSAYLFLKMGLISDLRMEEASERKYPFMVSFASFLLLGQLFWKLPLPIEFSIFAYGAAISSLIALFSIPFSKISIHMLAIGGVLGALIAIAGQYYLNVLPAIVVLFLIAGFLGTARLVLKAHKLSEIYIGFGVGFIVEFFLISYIVIA